MPTKTAVKTGEYFLTALVGPQTSLPDMAAFSTARTSALYFENYGDLNGDPLLVNSPAISPTEWSLKAYSISNSGFLQISALNIPEPSSSGGSRTFNIPYLLDDGILRASRRRDISTVFYFMSAFGYAPGDGVVNLTSADFVTVSTTAFQHFTSQAAFIENPCAMGIYKGFSSITYDENSNSGVIDFYTIENNGSIGQKFTIANISADPNTSNYNFGLKLTIQDGNDFYSICDGEIIGGVPELLHIEFEPVTIGNAPSAIVSDLALDDSALFDLIKIAYDYWEDGSYFYFAVFFEAGFSPIAPRIIRVQKDWSGYSIFNVIPGDTVMQNIFDDYMASNGSLGFAYSKQSGMPLLTGGFEPPVIYGILNLITGNVTTKNPFPIGLPCMISCIPVIDRRLRK